MSYMYIQKCTASTSTSWECNVGLENILFKATKEKQYFFHRFLKHSFLFVNAFHGNVVIWVTNLLFGNCIPTKQ